MLVRKPRWSGEADEEVDGDTCEEVEVDIEERARDDNAVTADESDVEDENKDV